MQTTIRFGFHYEWKIREKFIFERLPEVWPRCDSIVLKREMMIDGYVQSSEREAAHGVQCRILLNVRLCWITRMRHHLLLWMTDINWKQTTKVPNLFWQRSQRFCKKLLRGFYYSNSLPYLVLMSFGSPDFAYISSQRNRLFASSALSDIRLCICTTIVFRLAWLCWNNDRLHL